MFEELFDKSDRRLEKLSNEMSRMNQRLASLEHNARQPHPAMEANVQADIKTRECTEGATEAVQAMHGIAFLQTGSIPTRYARNVSTTKSNLPLSLAGATSRSRTALRRLSRASHP